MNWFKRLVRKLFPTDEEMHIAPTAPVPLMPRGLSKNGWQPITSAEVEALKRQVTSRASWIEHRKEMEAKGFERRKTKDGGFVWVRRPVPPPLRQVREDGRRVATSPAHAAPYGSRPADTDYSDPYPSMIAATLLASDPTPAACPAPAPEITSGRGGDFGGGGASGMWDSGSSSSDSSGSDSGGGGGGGD